MLNTSIKSSHLDFDDSSYKVPNSIALNSLHENESFETGTEYRLQDVYGEELWIKLARAKIKPEMLGKMRVLEVCCGTGFLTYHLLKRVSIKDITVNDFSKTEIDQAKKLLTETFPRQVINYAIGDMHTLEFDNKFDLIIGNSFLHHFHDVPAVLEKFYSLLRDDGLFVALHEPTPMTIVTETRRSFLYPFAVIAPRFLNNLARKRYKGPEVFTDIWLFQVNPLRKILLKIGFREIRFYPWHLIRSIVSQNFKLPLSKNKTHLSKFEEFIYLRSFLMDAFLNRFLNHRFFGSIFIVVKK